MIQSQPTLTLFPQPVRWSQAVWSRLIKIIAPSSLVSMESVISESGTVIWRAYDPKTGETRYAETEAEAIDWVEAHQYGETRDLPHDGWRRA